MMSGVLSQLTLGKDLSYSQSVSVFNQVFSGKVTDPQIKSLLVLLARKGETADEIRGCGDSLKKNEPRFPVRMPGLTDTCGTGGDQSCSLNISTLSAIVTAGAGAKVAKHGNRAFTSKCGSSDLMEALGVKLEAGPAKMAQAIRKSGIGYFHAPAYHPAVGRLQKIRKELKIRTIFNLLGPLANPLQPDRKLVGVSSGKAFEIYLNVLRKAGLKRGLLVHSQDGMDEISTSVPTQAALIERGRVKKMRINPRAFGLRKVSKSGMACCSPAESKALSLRILQGKEKGAVLDVILINAGAAIWVSGKAQNLQEGINLARKSITSGKAFNALKGLIKISNS